MKKIICSLVLIISSSAVMAHGLMWDCQNKYGDTVATLSYPSQRGELTLQVKIEAGYRPAFSAIKLSENVYEGRNGLLEVRPVLDLNKGTLTINKNIIKVECYSDNQGGE